MKNLVLLAIPLIVLTSLCANLPQIEIPGLPSSNQVQQSSTILTVDSGSPDIFLSVETSPPSEIRLGRTLQITFELKNKKSYNLRNVSFEVFDHPCFNDADNSGLFSKNLGNISADQNKIWSWKWTPDSSISLERTCTIKFKTSYEGDYSFYKDIAVLPAAEYYQRESEGTLNNIVIGSSSSDSPLDIQVTFSENRPFLENQMYYMYINYYNKGQGLFDNKRAYNPDIRLTIPNNIVVDESHCGNYKKTTTNVYRLVPPAADNNNLVFLRGKATPTTCTFNTSKVPTINIKTLSLTATYKYVLDNSISITVKP